MRGLLLACAFLFSSLVPTYSQAAQHIPLGLMQVVLVPVNTTTGNTNNLNRQNSLPYPPKQNASYGWVQNASGAARPPTAGWVQPVSRNAGYPPAQPQNTGYPPAVPQTYASAAAAVPQTYAAAASQSTAYIPVVPVVPHTSGYVPATPVAKPGSKDWVQGVRGPNDQLLFKTIVHKEGSLFKGSVSKEITFPDSKSKLRIGQITSVVVIDNTNKGTGGNAKITSGGIGKPYITLKLKSAGYNTDIDLSIEIWGKLQP